MTEYKNRCGYESCVVSPITGDTNVTVLHDICAKDITKKYKVAFEYDISYLFSGIDVLSLYKCQTTGYKFYWPAVEGDSRFYEHLQKYPWYYMPWKWEHEEAIGYLKENMEVLEIGCGQGGFLTGAMARRKLAMTGLELNEFAVKECCAKGLHVIAEDIKTHSLGNKNKYDVVCAFQVLEHAYDVKLFLQSAVESLKPGGLLIISVPNDESFIGESFSCLNAPPHHVGLWSKSALCALAEHFGLEVKTILFEPLQKYHVGSLQSMAEINLTGGNILKRAIYRITGYRHIINRTINYASKWMNGHSVLAIYTRKNEC